MLNKILRYGVIAGVIVAVPMLGMTFLMDGHHLPTSYGMLIGYSTMLIALSTVFVAIKRHRDESGGGVIGFWPAFALGLGISFVASVCYVLAWEATVAITHMDFANSYASVMIEQQKARGLSGAALDKFIAQMEQFKIDYANPLFRLPMTFVEIFPVGVLVSLISAGLLRNRRFLALRRA
jgi:hypothetical protein